MSHFSIAIDVGGTNYRVALVEHQEDSIKLLNQQKFSLHRDWNQGIQELADRITSMAHDRQVLGIGCSFPGDIDTENGAIVWATNLPEWQSQPIKARLEQLTNLPVVMEHDVAAAALGEARYGDGQAVDSLVFLIWGTGFGGAKVEKLNGQLHTTSFEAGHYVADPNGDQCECGLVGCPEMLIGGGPLSKKFGDLSKISDQDPVWEQVAQVAAQTVTNVYSFHPTRLMVFGGGLILARPFLLEKVQAWLPQQVREKVELKLSRLGDSAALYGMANVVQASQVKINTVLC